MFTILEFHNITKRGVGLTKVSPERFAQMLDLLRANTEIIEPRGLERYIQAPDEAGAPKVMISFDDGYEEIQSVAYPMMRERGLAGLVSLVTGYVGQRNLWDLPGGDQMHLSWSQIDELLGKGWSVCSHTMTHPDLKRTSDDRLRWELEESKLVLERHLGMEIAAVAYPFGRFNARVLSAARRAGYRIGFTVGAEPWKGPRGPLTTIRVPVYQIDSDALILAKVSPDGFLKRLDALKSRYFNRVSLLVSFARRRSFKGIPRIPPAELE